MALTTTGAVTVGSRVAGPVARAPWPRQRPLLPGELRSGRDRPGTDRAGAGDQRGFGDCPRRPAVRADRAAVRLARSGVRAGVEAGDAAGAGAGAARLA